jgi:ketosteroid isomerase-like protein
MRPVRLSLLLIASISTAALLAACGGGGGNDDNAQITDVIQTSVKSTDPADCTKLETQQFVEQSELASGQAAIQQCQQDAADTSDNPDSVDVTDVSSSGDTGSATVTFHGGSFDGSTLKVALTKDGDQWKLDKITDIPTFNFEGIVNALSARLQADSSIPPQAASCITQAFSSAGADQVKSIILSGNGDQLTALFSSCAPSG